MIIITAVNVGYICFFHRFHGVAAYTKFGVTGGMKSFLTNQPGHEGQNKKGDNAQND
jgi:hypothetical protein